MRIHTLFALAVASLLTAADPTTNVTAAAPTSATSPLTFTINFSAPVQGLTAPELVVTGGSVGGLAAVSPSGGYASQWLVSVIPATQGTVTLQVPAGAASTVASENNLLSNSLPVLYDAPPTLSYGVPAFTATQVTFRIGFNEAWTTANASLVTVSGARIDSQGQVGSGASATYDLVVTPWGNGDIRLDVAAGAFRDTDGTADANAAGGFLHHFGPLPGGTQAVVNRVRFISATDHSYDTGEAVDLEVVFSRTVSVAGPAGSEPVLLLNSQGSNASAPRATYLSTSGSAVRFRYTVASGNYTPALDYTGTGALVVASQGAIVGDDGFLAETGLASPGSAGSLRGSGAVGVNYTPPKPPVSEVAGPNTVDSCGAGSGIGLLLAAGLLLASTRYRRR